MADLVDCYKIILNALKRWNLYLDRRGTVTNLADFEFYAIQDFLMAMGQGIFDRIGTPTILLLMDTDFATYSQLT